MAAALKDFENHIFLGDCLEVLKNLPDNALDACVVDPPYGLGNKEPTMPEIVAYLQGEELDTGGDFMGKRWSVPSVAVWKEVFRVLKPGAHVLCFAGTRTFDLISIGLRAAGFEMRDTISEDHPCLQWRYGQGFPKSLNVGKAIDEAVGAVREVLGPYRTPDGQVLTTYNNWQDVSLQNGTQARRQPMLTAPATENAKNWEGWGTALKPSWEPVLVYRKPLIGTVAQNVVSHGTGAINIDACRVQSDGSHFRTTVTGRTGGMTVGADDREGAALGMFQQGKVFEPTNHAGGRWPPNLVMTHSDGCKKVGSTKVPATSVSKNKPGTAVRKSGVHQEAGGHQTIGRENPVSGYGDDDGTETVTAWECVEGCPIRALDEQDTGRVSRFFPQFEGQTKVHIPFFYTSKPSKSETTLEGEIENNHPTKKPVALMRWLVKLVTPKGGIVLDPYCGSGSTLHAAVEEGCRFVGIERDPSFHEISRRRMGIVCERAEEEQGQRDAFEAAMMLGAD